MTILKHNELCELTVTNPNYCATVVKLGEVYPLPNCDNVRGTRIHSYQVIVGKESQPGDVVIFFPVETSLSKEFLQQNNLFRKGHGVNRNPDKFGFFEDNGRVKCIRFRGQESAGFAIPPAALSYLKNLPELKVGDEFNEINGGKICEKYIRLTANRKQGVKSSGASRRVLKGAANESLPQGKAHYYKSDIWGVVAREVGPSIPKGWTLYGEIVGFTPEGAEIQPGYDYGCQPREHKFIVYRITVTPASGKPVELNHREIIQWCQERDIEHCKWIPFEGDLVKLMNYIERDCLLCNSVVPCEGVVLRVERDMFRYEVYKLKSMRFLERETKQLDAGASDIEEGEN